MSIAQNDLRTLDLLRAWMLKNAVIELSVQGYSLKLAVSAFLPKTDDSELAQPEGSEVEFPDDLKDQTPEGMMFFSSKAGGTESQQSLKTPRKTR